MTVGAGFTGIQNAHHFEVHLADFHRAFQQGVHVGRPGAQPCHDFVVLGINVVVVLAEYVRVLHIRRSTFQTVQAQQAQAEDVLANRRFVFIGSKFGGLTL